MFNNLTDWQDKKHIQDCYTCKQVLKHLKIFLIAVVICIFIWVLLCMIGLVAVAINIFWL